MHTIINPSQLVTRRRATLPVPHAGFRQPSYECRDELGSVKLVVYVPGVGASGVEIEARGPDLVITARKPQFVRVNWQALHLESAQRDYRLRLRLGTSFDYPAMQAEIHEGVLTVTLPKSGAEEAAPLPRLRQVA